MVVQKPMRTKRLIPILAVFTFSAGIANAQPRSIGAETSPTRVGLLFQPKVKSGENAPVNNISFGIDITGPMRQRNPYPGFYFDYSCDFNLVHKSGKDVVFDLLAGPGVDLGFGEDIEHPAGVFIGPMADVRAGITFRSTQLSFFIVARPSLSLHLYKTPDGYNMGMYKHGLMSSFIPQFGISYRFDHEKMMDENKWEGEEKKTPKRDYPLITYGIEYSYIAQFHVVSHFNYIAASGREDLWNQDFSYNTNGQVLAHFGFNAFENLNVALYAGYMGITRKQRIFPVMARATVLFGKHDDPGRWFSFIGGGIGIKGSRKMFGNAIVADTGFGYRVNLTRETKLDLTIGMTSTYWHPNTFSESIDVRRSNEVIAGLKLGVGLSF